MHALHAKFENQFSIMETEVRRRDDMINDLHIRLSQGSVATVATAATQDRNEQEKKSAGIDCDSPPDKSSSGSSGELLFMVSWLYFIKFLFFLFVRHLLKG